MVFKFILRFLILIVWLTIIYAFLMLPYFFQKNDEFDRTLRVYTWANRIDEVMLRNFEQQTGIKVYLNYYESSEELLTKLQKMPAMDCDVMLPSGNLIKSLIDARLVKKIDKSRCLFMGKIYPQFLRLYFDPQNEYSLPLYWDVFGIGFNKDVVGDRPITLDLLFNKNKIIGDAVGMTDDAREGIFLAASYLGLKLHDFSHEKLKRMRQLLSEQRAWVGSYSDTQQGYYLASHAFTVVASDRESICRQMLTNNFIGFALIPSGSMMRTDSIVISASTKKDDLVYQFINYLFSYDVLKYHSEEYCILPTTKDVFEQLDKKYIGLENLYPGSIDFKKLVIFQHGLTQKQINDFWIRFKAS